MAYPKFFKIVVNPRGDKLRIPTEFIRRHGRNLPDHVSIRAPKGAVRAVHLLRSDGDTWLHKGWNEFKEYYSIGFGHLLLFIYDRNSKFDVLIYSMDGVEIDYPHDNANRRCDRVPQTSDTESEPEESVLLLKEISRNKKSMGGRKSMERVDHRAKGDFCESPENPPARQERKRKRPNDRSEISDNCPAQKPCKGMPKFSPRAKEHSRKKMPSPNCDESVRASRVRPVECKKSLGKRCETTMCRESSIAYQKAKSSKFCNPCYISMMQPSYLYKYILSISKTFLRAHLRTNQKYVKLRDLNGKMWSVKCHKLKGHSAKLTIGWKEFVMDNALKVGDVCVFEVIERDGSVWDVTIFRS